VKIRRVFVLLFSAIAVLALFTGVLSAHHGRAGYDTKGQGITLRGVVTEYKWINPHVFLNWNVKNEKGEVVEWTGEFSSPTTMISEGMGKNTFKAGDEIIANGYPGERKCAAWPVSKNHAGGWSSRGRFVGTPWHSDSVSKQNRIETYAKPHHHTHRACVRFGLVNSRLSSRT
jgi:hypothetical protein